MRGKVTLQEGHRPGEVNTPLWWWVENGWKERPIRMGASWAAGEEWVGTASTRTSGRTWGVEESSGLETEGRVKPFTEVVVRRKQTGLLLCLTHLQTKAPSTHFLPWCLGLAEAWPLRSGLRCLRIDLLVSGQHFCWLCLTCFPPAWHLHQKCYMSNKVSTHGWFKKKKNRWKNNAINKKFYYLLMNAFSLTAWYYHEILIQID